MTPEPTPKKRRSVSKARLYTELQAEMSAREIGPDQSIAKLLDALRDAIVEEAVR